MNKPKSEECYTLSVVKCERNDSKTKAIIVLQQLFTGLDSDDARKLMITTNEVIAYGPLSKINFLAAQLRLCDPEISISTANAHQS